jgi:PLP dependent protein
MGSRRVQFGILRALLDTCRAAGLPMDTLSMGMTDDLEAAVAEGATIVRIGTALFGPRAP